MKQLCTELTGKDPAEPVIFEDNQSAIAMTRNPRFHGRSKHVGIKYHFVRDKVTEGTIKVKYCSTTEMIADVLTKGLTKGLPKAQFVKISFHRRIISYRTVFIGVLYPIGQFSSAYYIL